tara:strand:+ start:644 stop:799 length:156 start_codon:yes stop_codon:yes gene_type:complete
LLASDGFCKVEVDFERGQDERELSNNEYTKKENFKTRYETYLFYVDVFLCG